MGAMYPSHEVASGGEPLSASERQELVYLRQRVAELEATLNVVRSVVTMGSLPQ